MYRYGNGQPVGFQAAGQHKSEGKQPLGQECLDDPVAGDGEPVHRPVYQPQRKRGQAAAAGP